jgi:hypothetical protein
MILLSIALGVAFFLALVLVAVYLIGRSSRPDEPAQSPIIHASGIYSIVRRSPREMIDEIKPSIASITKYLADKNEDITGAAISSTDKTALVSDWQKKLEMNISEIEAGDDQSINFYYYDFTGEDPVCKKYLDQGHFVSREEIFKCPQIIPPFHIGCRCALKAHKGTENLRDTTKLGMRPFFSGPGMPPVPRWSDILKLS